MIGDRWNSPDDGGAPAPACRPDPSSGEETLTETRAVPDSSDGASLVPMDPSALEELLERFQVHDETLLQCLARLGASGPLGAELAVGISGMFRDLAVAAAAAGRVRSPSGARYAVNPDWPWRHRDPWP